MSCRRVQRGAPLRSGGGDDGVRIKLDRTMCDGFGACARHAPEYFSLDDWGYASLEGNGAIPEQDRDAVMRALLDCPVHAIIELSDSPTAAPQDARS
ncbi:ferredoxin [Mycobacterium sp.]|uniref:ferredoxin n=1 Tax=Mycobacterium sp. TaxID=1785 RepID=UPI00333EFE85